MNRNPRSTGVATGETTLLTTQELADLLKVSTRTISRMKSAGELPEPVMIGRLVRWKRADIETWLSS